MEEIKGRLKSFISKKLLCALLAGFVAFANLYFGWNLSTQQIWTVIAPLLGYIVVEGTSDLVRRFNGK